jgi:hypothetical protein
LEGLGGSWVSGLRYEEFGDWVRVGMGMGFFWVWVWWTWEVRLAFLKNVLLRKNGCLDMAIEIDSLW